MNAEKTNCLSPVKGRCPNSRRDFAYTKAEINTLVCSEPFLSDSLNIQHIKSETDDYQNRGGK